MKRSSLYRDERGELELPMKLIISAIVLAIILPAVFGALYVYQKNQMELDMEMQVDAIVDKIHMAHRRGNNSSVTLEVDLPGKLMSGWSYVKLGDNIEPIGPDNPGGEFSKRIRYKVKGQSVSTENVDCLLTNDARNGPLVLEERAHFKLKFTHLDINKVSFVSVRDITYS